ncbi:carboxymuconolactone decarboxylase family protein [Paraburkholderia sp. GAS42]|jgi:uncharacterized peroxidase-related enzyme|uniref:carboxymuconolactone decarboxylase family protein n=1 Tax=Paraburkholderia sp. GAS42 TaxID=3035135 RepID=UPI003D2147AC
MSRIKALSIEHSPASTQAPLKGIEKTMGFLPNVFRTLANSPVSLSGYLQLSQNLSKGELSPVEREIIALAVGQVNECEYCVSAHVLYAARRDLSDEEIQAARRGEGTIFASLAHKVATQRGRISDADLAAAREAGLSDSQIVELVVNVAHLTFTNYVNNVAQTDVDFPLVEV